MVGWQITITKDGSFVQNSSIVKELSIAVDEAHAYIDDQIASAGTTRYASGDGRLALGVIIPSMAGPGHEM
jgi:hypothetical protein